MEQLLFSYIESHMPLLEGEKQIIRDLALIKAYKKGTVLLEEGKRSVDTYFVLKGGLRSFYMVEGEEKTTEFYTELETLAPICVISGTPSEYYISCFEDTLLLISNPAIEQVAFEKFPRFEMLCRVMSEKLAAKKQARFDNFKISSPEKRYTTLLETRPDLFQRVPQHQLASYLGITPASLSRMRSRITRKDQ